MRTRIFNKMTAREVEEYLARGGDTLFIGVGVIEAHSNMPIDAEQIGSEAMAVLMAEKADGPARFVIEPVCRDFFQETKIHLCYINPFFLAKKLMEKRGEFFDIGKMGLMKYPEIEDTTAGAYRIMGMEEAVGTLEAKHGFFSVHDKMKDLLRHEEASRVLMNCILATAQRALPDVILTSGDPEWTVAEFCSQGLVGSMLGDKKESTVRRVHSALLAIKK